MARAVRMSSRVHVSVERHPSRGLQADVSRASRDHPMSCRILFQNRLIAHLPAPLRPADASAFKVVVNSPTHRSLLGKKESTYAGCWTFYLIVISRVINGRYTGHLKHIAAPLREISFPSHASRCAIVLPSAGVGLDSQTSQLRKSSRWRFI
jgi:hypothetical protein